MDAVGSGGCELADGALDLPFEAAALHVRTAARLLRGGRALGGDALTQSVAVEVAVDAELDLAREARQHLDEVAPLGEHRAHVVLALVDRDEAERHHRRAADRRGEHVVVCSDLLLEPHGVLKVRLECALPEFGERHAARYGRDLFTRDELDRVRRLRKQRRSSIRRNDAVHVDSGGALARRRRRLGHCSRSSSSPMPVARSRRFSRSSRPR